MKLINMKHFPPARRARLLLDAAHDAANRCTETGLTHAFVQEIEAERQRCLRDAARKAARKAARRQENHIHRAADKHRDALERLIQRAFAHARHALEQSGLREAIDEHKPQTHSQGEES
jgi:hypothetical protein